MDFWDAFFLLAIFIPLTILWVTCILDLVLRRGDMSGWARAAWVAAIIVLPALGSLAYIAVGRLPASSSAEAPTSSPRDEALRATGRMP